MATPAQCYYCFESLSASFQRTEPPNLPIIEDLWEQFEASKDLALEADSKKVTDARKNPSIELNVDADKSDQDCQDDATDDSEDGQRTRAPTETLQPPSIRRLQGGSSSRSSSSSAPSALSTSSSRSALTSASSTTSATSPKSSSFFSSSKSYSENIRSDISDATYPLFVTWNIVSRSGQKTLRGCIGTFEPQELAPGLKSYALTSAFGDTRFSPIPESLMSSLSCSLTLLSSFETCSHAMDWDLGTHGLRISFIHRGRRFGATYLPDVAIEQGWTKEETVDSLMRKSGWDGTTSYAGGVTRRILRGSDKPWDGVTDFKAVRYQGFKASATYAEWQEWRRWVKSSTS